MRSAVIHRENDTSKRTELPQMDGRNNSWVLLIGHTCDIKHTAHSQSVRIAFSPGSISSRIAGKNRLPQGHEQTRCRPLVCSDALPLNSPGEQHARSFLFAAVRLSVFVQ